MNETIKRYVVVKSSTGSIDLWTKEVYKRYLNGFTIGDGTGHPYTAITTFNEDEELGASPDIQVLVEAVKVLEELVELKQHKDVSGKTSYYESMQPKLWDKARKILLNPIITQALTTP